MTSLLRHKRKAMQPHGPQDHETRTWALIQRDRAARANPVRALYRIPHGPRYCLDEIQLEYGDDDDARLSWIVIGRRSTLHICIHDDETVSDHHCLIMRDMTTGATFIEDAGSKNGVRVRGVPIIGAGQVEFVSGDLISLGEHTLLLACGSDGEQQRPVLFGPNFRAILLSILDLCGGCSTRCSEVLGVPRSTLQRWLTTGRFSNTPESSNDGEQ